MGGIGHCTASVTAPNCREAAVLFLLCIIGAIHQLDNASSSIVQSISGTSGCQWMSQAPRGWVLRKLLEYKALRSTPVQPITLKTVNGSQARPEKEDRSRTNKFSLWNLPSFGCNFPADIKQLSRCVYWLRNGGPARQLGGSHGTWNSYPGNRIGCLPLFLGESRKAILQCCVTSVVLLWLML